MGFDDKEGKSDTGGKGASEDVSKSGRLDSKVEWTGLAMVVMFIAAFCTTLFAGFWLVFEKDEARSNGALDSGVAYSIYKSAKHAGAVCGEKELFSDKYA